MPGQHFRWTNPSVLLFAEGSDPISSIEKKARSIALVAIDKGWEGPPFDPIKLADMLKISVSPRDEVPDARTVPQGRKGYAIQFNPSRARGRVRFSIAHEIAHTFFPDCDKRVRNREHHKASDDNWQLEMLCNIAAAELIMPLSGISELAKRRIDIDLLIALQRKFDVSMEALLIRATKISEDQFLFFTASRSQSSENLGRYKIDYSIPSRSWRKTLPPGFILPAESIVADCNAIGYTAKSVEAWPGVGSGLRVECVGLPPYPGTSFPRVVGIVRDDSNISDGSDGRIEYLQGSALEPIGPGSKVIVHVINDKTANWGGGGFAAQVKKTLPDEHRLFRDWTLANSENLSLGNTFGTYIDADLFLFNMVAQHGFGASEKPRIRYSALEKCLIQLAEYAMDKEASVHMPRIGTGHAGGNWNLIEELIVENVLRSGIAVYVYDLPNRYSSHATHDFHLANSPKENKQANR